MSAAAGARPAPARSASAERSRRHCEQVTRHAAANFYWGIRLLSEDKRSAMCAVYAYARRIDDIGDGTLPAAEKLRRLEQARAGVRALGPDSDDDVMAALADAARRFPLPRQSLLDLIDGVEMDVNGSRFATIEELVVYCRRVAGSIGRLCLAIFGCSEPVDGGVLADDLGVAMQLTNILRDVREDALNGRVYLPEEDLRRFGWAADSADTVEALRSLVTRSVGRADGDTPADVVALVRFEASRARDWFERGLALVPLLDRRSAASVLAMSGIYRRLLERIDRRPGQIMRTRVSLPVPEKLWIAGTSLLRGVR